MRPPISRSSANLRQSRVEGNLFINKIMTAALKNLAETVTQLPPKDRAFLAERLLDSLDEDEIEQAWMGVARRRRDEVRSGKVKPIPAEDVYRRIETLLKK